MSKRSTAALLKKARRRRVPFTVLLDLGDGLHDLYDETVDKLEGMADDDPERDAVKATLVELNDRLREAEVEGTFEQAPPFKWAALLEEHPPRDGNQADYFFGANRASVMVPAIRACMVDPDLDDEQWDALLDVLSTGDVERLGRQVFDLNARTTNGAPKLPKDFLAATPPSSD